MLLVLWIFTSVRNHASNKVYKYGYQTQGNYYYQLPIKLSYYYLINLTFIKENLNKIKLTIEIKKRTIKINLWVKIR